MSLFIIVLSYLSFDLLLFGSTHVNFSSLFVHCLSELFLPIGLDLVEQRAHPLRLQGSEDVVHCQLVRPLPEVDVGAVTPGVALVLRPRVILRLPPVQLLPTEVTADQVRLVLTSAAVEARLRYLLWRAKIVLFERPTLQCLHPPFHIQHQNVFPHI